MIFGIIYCAIWIVILLPLLFIMIHYIKNNDGSILSSNLMIFTFLAITLIIRGFTLIPILTDPDFKDYPTKCQEAAFEYMPLVTFLIAMMVNTYRFYIIKRSPKICTKIICHFFLWAFILFIPSFNILFWVDHEFDTLQRVTLYVGLGVYAAMNIICALINVYIMSCLFKKLNWLLFTMIFISVIRVISVTVYTFYKGNHFGALNDFEFMLILSFTELIPVIMIITSFMRYMNTQGDEAVYSQRFSSNLQEQNDSVQRTDTIVSGDTNMNDKTR